MYNIAETYNKYNNDILLRSLKNDLYDNEKKSKQLEDLFKEVKGAFLPEGIEIGDINGDELYELYQEFKKMGGKSKEDFALFIKERKLLKNSKIKKPKLKNRIKLFFCRRKLFRKIANSLRVIKIKYFQKTRSFDDELFIMKMRFGVKTANKVKEELEKLGITDLKEQVDFNVLKISTNKVFYKDEELLNFVNKEKERKGFLETIKECMNNIVDSITGAKSEAKEFNTFLESIGQKFQVGNKIKISRKKDIIAISKLVEKGERSEKSSDLENNFISTKESTQEYGIIGQLKKSMALSKSIDLEAKTTEKTTKKENTRLAIKKENEVEKSAIKDTKTAFKPAKELIVRTKDTIVNKLNEVKVGKVVSKQNIEQDKVVIKDAKNAFKSVEKTTIQEVKNDFKRDIGIEKAIEKILNKKKEMATSKTMEQQKETKKEQLMNKLDNKQETKLNEIQAKVELTKTIEAKPIVGENTRRLAERRQHSLRIGKKITYNAGATVN